VWIRSRAVNFVVPTTTCIPDIDDGWLTYQRLVDNQRAWELLGMLQDSLQWQNETVRMFGKTLTLKRKVAWHSLSNQPYTYASVAKQGSPYTDELHSIHDLVERITGNRFNACLANYYHDGTEAMGWHADNEASIVPSSAIASVSFGAERDFAIRHRITGVRHMFPLHHGSVLCMGGAFQQYWQHSLPVRRRCKAARINLTFRLMQ
jgi:alkylated DNA repair dioxygenase AlkB